jgi:hypothetical protein
MNKYLLDMVPLHLHAQEIDLTKKTYKKQSVAFKQTLPFLPYFEQTLSNLGLKMKKPVVEQNNQTLLEDKTPK